jgi:hypothetical protein
MIIQIEVLIKNEEKLNSDEILDDIKNIILDYIHKNKYEADMTVYEEPD